MIDAAASPLAGFLPKVSPDAARLSRIGCDARLQRWLRRLARRGDIAVARHPAAADAVLSIEAGDGCFDVAIDTRERPALALALQLDDDAAACAVASALLTPWLDMLGSALAAPRVAARRAAGAAADAQLAVCITAANASAQLLRVDARIHDAVRRALAGVPAGATALLPSLRLRPRLTLLRRSLPPAVLAGLRAGDVVLLEGARRSRPRFQFSLGKGLIMQTDATLDPHTGQPVVDGHPTLQAEDLGPEEAATLDELQVPVSFEVDTARITLAELASIRPGYVIELDRPIESATVRLVCHGQAVGQGQLVAVGEQLGIRIIAMGLGARAADSGSAQ